MRNLALFLFLHTAALGQTQQYNVDDLAWLGGCWGGGSADRAYQEQWMKPSGKTMLGMSRTVAKGETVEYEFLRLHEEANGDILYTAKPSGQDEASFKLVKLTGNEVVFENPEHDFPQRIIYRLNEDNSLTARIEGKSKGKDRGVDFPMKRVSCD
jgi:hypothetical protein